MIIVADWFSELYVGFCLALIGGVLLLILIAFYYATKCVERFLDIINEAIIRVIREKKEREKQVDKR